jgi:hypothetical protein
VFEELKVRLSIAFVLKFLDFSKPFKVHTNSSGFVVGGVLMQEGHPIAFESKKLVGAQLRLPTHK